MAGPGGNGAGAEEVSLVSRALGREQALARLLALDGRGELTTEHAQLVARSAGVSLRPERGGVRIVRAFRQHRMRQSASGSLAQQHGDAASPGAL